MKQKKNIIFSLILAVMLLTAAFPQTSFINGEETESQVVTESKVSYDFATETAGEAYGTITLHTQEADSYDLYWGDKDGEKLTCNGVEYSELGTCTTTEEGIGTFKIENPYTAIPQGAEELMVYDSQGEKVADYDIPDNKVFNKGNAAYKFAIMSDVHFNRYYDEQGNDQALSAFDNALKFWDNQRVELITLTGDLSTNGEISAYQKFNSAIKKYPNMTVYTVTGNHDTRSISNFYNNINLKNKSDKNVRSISNNGMDFIYLKGNDVFIFFSQVRWSYNSKYSTLVTDEQLNWLEKNLNTYANKNIYLYFHSFFAASNGDVTKGVGNLMNPGGYTYDLTYTYGTSDEKRFRSLLNKYPNITLFSGHSHWSYDMQKYNSALNIGNVNSIGSGATLVHISSVTEPRAIGTDDSDRTGLNGQSSQGTLALRYNGCTVYTGVDFISGKYLAYATYLNSDGKTSTPVPAVKTGNTKIKSVTRPKKISKYSKKYKVTIRLKKVTGAVGYEIKYSTSKKFKAAKTKTRRTTKTKYIITKLKAKTTYYIKVRAYKKQFGYRIYGNWTKTVKVKNVRKQKEK